MTYVVIENTPGYLPEDDDPGTFEDFVSAVAYMDELIESYLDDCIDTDTDEDGIPGLYHVDRHVSAEDGYAYASVTPNAPHRLRRAWEVTADED